MDWYLGLGIGVLGALMYLGLGRTIAKLLIMLAREIVENDRRRRDFQLTLARTWILVFLWPLYVAAFLFLVALVALVIGIIVIIVAFVVLILAVLLISGLIAAIVFSFFEGINCVGDIITHFNPLPPKK